MTCRVLAYGRHGRLAISPEGMEFFTALTCTTTLPDDHEWDEAGEETVKPGGESAAYALADLLRQAGMDVSTPELWEDYGWCFDVNGANDNI